MPKLTANCVVSREPGQVVVLMEGDDLPEWAEGMVGDHLLADDPVAADDPVVPDEKPASPKRRSTSARG